MVVCEFVQKRQTRSAKIQIEKCIPNYYALECISYYNLKPFWGEKMATCS